MPELIIHAGAGKTGTSLLQVLFARHAEELERAGIIYPRGDLFDEAVAGGITSGNGMAMANYIRSDLPEDWRDKRTFLEHFTRELSSAARQGNHVLYSSEFLAFEPGEKSDSIAATAARHNFTPRFIYFVRDVDSAAFSVYSQCVKRHGETRSFPEFLDTWRSMDRTRIEEAVNLFGAERVEVYNYSEKREELVEFFFRNLLRCDFVPSEIPTVNRSLSGKETEFLRYMNAALGNNDALGTFVSDALMEFAKETKSEPMLLTKEEADLLESRSRSDLAYINRLIIGRPCAVASTIGGRRSEAELTDIERATAAILAKIVTVVVKQRA